MTIYRVETSVKGTDNWSADWDFPGDEAGALDYADAMTEDYGTELDVRMIALCN